MLFLGLTPPKQLNEGYMLDNQSVNLDMQDLYRSLAAIAKDYGVCSLLYAPSTTSLSFLPLPLSLQLIHSPHMEYIHFH